ncbi:cyclin-J18 isoform X1 [Rhododendron vialii]|uniref:cyclin-J18 isoform X1 n=1 Tax=Rhododendron vialii TaxID=182163 RepID=UPI00265DEB9B|nr:cyclin-J18 isoform X1 [Rhododendron vialii]
MNSRLPSCVRLRLLEFLIQSARQLQVRPIVKYSALSLFSDRFCPALSRFRQSNDMESWLLHPLRESNLQLFSLVSIWISSKIHDSQPLSVKSLKLLGDKMIKEQHFTTRDFLEAEVLLMQVLGFEIGTANIAFKFLEELFVEFEGVARVGQLVNVEASMDIMDLLYEKEETSLLYYSPRNLAASILVATYVVTVPKQKWEFPVLPWVKFVTSCKEEDVLNIVRDILKHIFEPSSSVEELQGSFGTYPLH